MKIMILWGLGSLGKLWRIPWNAVCSTRQVCWSNDWPKWTPSSLDGTPEKIHSTRDENQCFYQKPLALYVLLTKPHSKSRTMLFSVPQRARTALYLLHFLGLAPFCGFGPDLVGIHSISGLQRAHLLSTQSRKKSMRHAGAFALLCFALSPAWKHEFSFSVHGLSHRGTYLMLSISWTVMTLLMEFRKTKTESCHWATSWQTSQTSFFLVLSLAVPRKPIDRSVVIVLLTFCATWKLFRVHLCLDCSLASFESGIVVMGFLDAFFLCSS